MDEESNIKSSLLQLISRVLNGRKKITTFEIQDLIKAGEGEGIVNEEESEMIRSIFTLRSTVVREVMVPRTDMTCIAINTDVNDLLKTILDCGHSRIPVYENTIDNIVGLLYAKDLLKHWGADDDQIKLRQIMRVPYFIPETKNIEQLLQEFKSKHVHLAIVIDEYGGTSGLITIEDLIEQIVGDIQDEHDREEELYSVNPDGSITADARMPIEDLEQYFSVEIERDKFDTVGGLIFHLSGKISVKGDQLNTDELDITVLDADERRIKKVNIRRSGSPGQDIE